MTEYNNNEQQQSLPEGDLGGSIELRSEEVQEVLGAVPPWILRWGITTLFVIVVVLLLGCWFFKYPDTIQASMTLTGEMPPANIVAKTTGRIKEIYTKYQQNLENNENFKKLIEMFDPKILSIFRTINCDYGYKDYFISDCYYKIFDVASKKHFNETSNDAVISSYFEQAFLTVRRDFIRNYGLYENIVVTEMLDNYGIQFINKAKRTQINTEERFNDINSILSKEEHSFLLNFLDKDNNQIRSVTQVATLLFVSKQAVSKRLRRIKDKIKSNLE